MRAVFAVIAGLCAGMAQAEGLTAPRLGAASNFNQGAQPAVLAGLPGNGIRDLRDGLNWNRAETTLGTYDFTGARLAYPASVAAAGASLSITLNWGNTLYDGGDTPHTAQGIAGFAAFAAAVAVQYPGVDAIEVGNEFNGTNFVKGPLKDMRPADRAAAYARILAATYVAAKGARPDLRILGGATHSIPAGYLWQVLDAGGAGHMDALAIHPYTTPPEQFVRQIAVLRRHPDAGPLPLEITEFGEPDATLAVGYFLRNYCQFALGGVTRAVWFPLTARGDGFVPLFDAGGKATPVGTAYRYADQYFAGKPVADVAPDPFTYGCRFGPDHIVLWGAARAVTPASDVAVLTATGEATIGAQMLSPTDPLIFHRAGGIDLARDLGLGPQTLLADSFDQFGYPAADGTPPLTDGFVRLARSNGREVALVTQPGQEAPGTPWTPYVTAKGFGGLRLTAETLLPGPKTDILHRYTAASDGPVTLSARFAAGKESQDGIIATVTLNGDELARGAGKDPIDLSLPDLPLAAGDVVEVAVSAGATAKGDLSRYRITLTRP